MQCYGNQRYMSEQQWPWLDLCVTRAVTYITRLQGLLGATARALYYLPLADENQYAHAVKHMPHMLVFMLLNRHKWGRPNTIPALYYQASITGVAADYAAWGCFIVAGFSMLQLAA
jgi:hypothetical protein